MNLTQSPILPMRLVYLWALLLFAGACGAEEPDQTLHQEQLEHLDTVEQEVTARSGWASQTGYQGADTAVRRSIVSRANQALGGSSGASKVTAPSGSSTTWQTDIAGGDGQRMRNAISDFHTWTRNGAGNQATIRQQMLQRFAGSDYSSTSKNLLLDRIISRYQSNPSVPSNDQRTLDFMGIRKQCLEWAVTTGIEAGGNAIGYDAPAVASANQYRPGMGLFKTNRTHAALLIDIMWSSNGTPTRYKIAESNWGSGWNNPDGMVPWERKVTQRELTSLSGYKVVRFDADPNNGSSGGGSGSTCSSGNGLYCGASIGRDPNELYRCSNGTISPYQSCAYGCQQMPSGQDDACKPYPNCHSGNPGSSRFCSSSCKCGLFEGDCDSNSECLSGLVCVQQIGTDYCEQP